MRTQLVVLIFGALVIAALPATAQKEPSPRPSESPKDKTVKEKVNTSGKGGNGKRGLTAAPLAAPSDNTTNVRCEVQCQAEVKSKFNSDLTECRAYHRCDECKTPLPVGCDCGGSCLRTDGGATGAGCSDKQDCRDWCSLHISLCGGCSTCARDAQRSLPSNKIECMERCKAHGLGR
jgi:hypothetical protein